MNSSNHPAPVEPGTGTRRSKGKPVSGCPELGRRDRPAAPGSEAEDELIKQHLPLVKTVVGRLAMTLPAHVDVEALNSAGLVGLLKAVRQYNPRWGASFETYARFRIRGAVLDELRRLDWVPRSVHAKARKVSCAMQALEQINGRPPTDVEMARALAITLTEYKKLLLVIRPVTFVCLDSVMNSDGDDGPTAHENIADQSMKSPYQCSVQKELARAIFEHLEHLPETERKVLALYYYEGLRLREIAEAYGLTESRISQIHTHAMLTLRSSLEKCEATGRDSRKSDFFGRAGGRRVGEQAVA
jgi:RNA polymerase sigma factor for flagellar operon FliA